jgi:hypothetical protein
VAREIRFGQQDATGDRPLDPNPRRAGVEGGRPAGIGGDPVFIPARRDSILPAAEYPGEQFSLDEHTDGWTLHREGAAAGEIAQRGDGFELRAREECWTAELVQPPLASWRLLLRGEPDHAEVGVYRPRRVGAGGTLAVGDDRYVLKGPWIFGHWIVKDPYGLDLARIRAYSGGESPQRRPVRLEEGADGKTTTTPVVLAACLAVIVSEAEPRCPVYPTPTC